MGYTYCIDIDALKAIGNAQPDLPRAERRIRLPVEKQSGRQSAGPACSDDVSTTVVFSDVAVGDVVGLKYRLTTTQPLYPRKLSLAGDFSLGGAYDDVHLLIDEPVSMKSRHVVRGMSESVRHAR